MTLFQRYKVSIRLHRCRLDLLKTLKRRRFSTGEKIYDRFMQTKVFQIFLNFFRPTILENIICQLLLFVGTTLVAVCIRRKVFIGHTNRNRFYDKHSVITTSIKRQGLCNSLKHLHQNFVLLTIYVKYVTQSLGKCDQCRWCNI